MHYYKLNIEQLGQVDEMNHIWLRDYKKLYPNDMITTGYAITTKIENNWYLLKDSITEKYINNFDAITNLPTIERPIVDNIEDGTRTNII